MKRTLCFFAIALMLFIYPCFQVMNPELVSIWGTVESDIFNWYRMLLVGAMGVFWISPTLAPEVVIYVSLLLLSVALSPYAETNLFGTPNHHEGLLAILGYVGIYMAAARLGLFRSLEKCLDLVVYILFGSCALQVLYGNFLDFYLFRALFPLSWFKATPWPLYGLTGNSNHLGLFVTLFLPYALLRKKHAQAAMLLLMLVGSECRSSIAGIVVTASLLSKKIAAIAGVCAVLILAIHPLKKTDFGIRSYVWRESLPLLRDTLVVGEGLATFPIYFKQFQPAAVKLGFEGVLVDRPHNMYINIWQNTGFLSLVTLATLAIRTLLRATDRSLSMGVLGFLISGFFTDSVLCVTPYFLIFLGALTHEHNEKRRSDQRTRRADDHISKIHSLLSIPGRINL